MKNEALATSFFSVTGLEPALPSWHVPKSCFPLVARATFDRGASFCSLLHPPGALATSPREPGGCRLKILFHI